MAKYKGIVWSDARGKVNGLVYSRNTFGVYVRNLASPVQPRTPAQENIRAALQNLARGWRELSNSQRAGWNELATQVSLTDTLGNTYHPTGEQLYCGLNLNLTLIGQSTIQNAPPAPVTIPTPSNVVVTATGGGTPALSVGWSNGSVDAHALVAATSTLSAGRSFIRPSEFRVIGHISGDGTTTSILTEWQAKYGAPPNPAAGKVAVRVKLVDPGSGFAGGYSHGIDSW